MTETDPRWTLRDPQKKRECRDTRVSWQKGAVRDVFIEHVHLLNEKVRLCPAAGESFSGGFTDATQQTLTRREWRRPSTWLDCLTDEDLQLPPCRTDWPGETQTETLFFCLSCGQVLAEAFTELYNQDDDGGIRKLVDCIEVQCWQIN